MAHDDPVIDALFIEAACVPLDGWHASGTLEAADTILTAHPEIASHSIHVAAVLGDDQGVRKFIALDAANATRTGGPHGWDPLTHLCFSRYLRLDSARSAGFVRAAQLLLAHGASANTGFFQPLAPWERGAHSEFESVLYGAAGVAHHEALTRLLLTHGADPNDGEVVYHAPEGFDNRALEALVESGKIGPDGLTTMLMRKLEWTDYAGAAWLLTHGADPNHLSHWGGRAVHHALGRDNPLPFLELLLDHGSDPRLSSKDGKSAAAIAARVGRADALLLFERRGFATEVEGDDALLGACARNDATKANEIVAADPAVVGRLQTEEPGLFADVAGSGNAGAARLMLDLGFDITSKTRHPAAVGDSALHLAVWRARHDMVKLLINRNAPLEARNRGDETPLSYAVSALVTWSEWTPHDSTALVEELLDAGANAEAVRRFPCGVAEADDLLRHAGRG